MLVFLVHSQHGFFFFLYGSKSASFFFFLSSFLRNVRAVGAGGRKGEDVWWWVKGAQAVAALVFWRQCPNTTRDDSVTASPLAPAGHSLPPPISRCSLTAPGSSRARA